LIFVNGAVMRGFNLATGRERAISPQAKGKVD
jgi:hypothetical protein